MSIAEEIALYKLCIHETKAQTFAAFWQENTKSLPILTTIVLEYSIMSGASLSSESAFSQANVIQTKQRHALSAEALQMSVFMKDKMTLMETLKLKNTSVITTSPEFSPKL